MAGTLGRSTTHKAGRAEPMSQNKPLAQSAAQAGPSGEATGVGPAVGGVRSSEDLNWLDLWAMNPETRAYLASARRDAACSHASSRREGAGDGPQGIRTPEKLRHLQDTLYRKAKAESVREQAECWRMKRPGKPDTGNPFVRFDEGRSGSAALTSAVSSIRLLPLRLLYLSFCGRLNLPCSRSEGMRWATN